MATNNGARPAGFYENKDVSIELARALVGALGSQQKLTAARQNNIALALASSLRTREAFVEDTWDDVEVPAPTDVRELMLGDWASATAPPPYVAIEIGMSEPDLFNPLKGGIDPLRIFGLYELVNEVVEAFHSAQHGQTLMQAAKSVAVLVRLVKPAYQNLTPPQVAVMGVAHNIKGATQLWGDWLDKVNEILDHWGADEIDMPEMKKEVAVLKTAGFSVEDTDHDLRIPRAIVVIPVQRFDRWIRGIRF